MTGQSTINIADLGDDSTTAMVIASLAQQAALPRQLNEGVFAILNPEGGIDVVETPGAKQQREHDWKMARREAPEFITRSVKVSDVPSLIDYLARNTAGEEIFEPEYAFGAGELEVWANLDSRSIQAILDGITGHRRHTATLQLRLSREWEEWSLIDGKLLPQIDFAQFIEDHLSTIGEPDGAVLLDICQTLQAHTSVAFKQQAILANGQRQFQWEETTEARAGQKGDLTIPGELRLVLRPFQGSEPVLVTARFRYQIREGVLKIGVKLAEPETALETAFTRVVDEVAELVPVHVFVS